MNTLFDNLHYEENEAEKVVRLRNEINEHNHRYYVENNPSISDKEFDFLLKELEALEEKHPELYDPLSPTKRVGSDLTKEFRQVPHIYPMLSLGNTYDIPEVDAFINRVKENIEGEEFSIVGELKFDGTSISLIYENGRLVRAVTRGDGEKGDVVTENVKTIKSIPLMLQGSDWPNHFEIRGEIVLPWKAFDKINQERAFNEEPLFANPRNAASGTLKLQNPAEVARRGLDAYFYYILGDDLPCDNHYDNMQAVRSWGFKVSENMTVLNSIKDVDDFITFWDIERKKLPVATDGLVFKINSLRQQLNLGFTAKSPRWAIAYKFQAERALTRLQYVSFEVGRMGLITPVSNLEPVLLSGTIVKRASLHNEDIMNKLDIHEHDMLWVEKGGEIIPKITGVDINQRKGDAKKVKFIKNCPSCNTPLVRVDGEAAWICPNKYGCKPQIAGRIEHFVGRRMMNIDGIGEETVVRLMEAGLVNNISDLYDLTIEKLLNVEGIAEKGAERIMSGIRDSLSVPFERVVYALSIPFVGETVARKLARTIVNIDNLMNATQETLENIPDIGPRIAESIKDYFDEPINKKNIERLITAGIRMQTESVSIGRMSNVFEGKTIVISGTFAHHSRDEYKELIEQNGGKNSGSVTKKTDMILAGENMGPAKYEKANQLGIPIINEETFLKMISDETNIN